MEFLAALIAVTLVQLWGSGAPLHRDGWFLRWNRWCAGQPVLAGMPALLLVVVISVPVFALLVVYYGIADEWWGLPKLAMLVLILLYSLGRGDFRKAMEAYSQAWRSGDIETATRLLRDFDCPPGDAETLPALHEQARARTLYRGFERMFAVLFWFAVAGPAFAFAYRLAFLYRYRFLTAGDAQAAVADNRLAVALSDQLLVLFEWLPARALGLGFVVVANVADGLKAWIDLMSQHAGSASAYLHAIGASVCGFRDPATRLDDSHDEAEFLAGADEELQQLQVLLNRALVLWLVMMALLQLIL